MQFPCNLLNRSPSTTIENSSRFYLLPGYQQHRLELYRLRWPSQAWITLNLACLDGQMFSMTNWRDTHGVDRSLKLQLLACQQSDHDWNRSMWGFINSMMRTIRRHSLAIVLPDRQHDIGISLWWGLLLGVLREWMLSFFFSVFLNMFNLAEFDKLFILYQLIYNHI
jgi:hypothetical protein